MEDLALDSKHLSLQQLAEAPRDRHFLGSSGPRTNNGFLPVVQSSAFGRALTFTGGHLITEDRFHKVHGLDSGIDSRAPVSLERHAGVAAAVRGAEKAALVGAGAVRRTRCRRGGQAGGGASQRKRRGTGTGRKARAAGLDEAGGGAVELSEVVGGRGVGAVVVVVVWAAFNAVSCRDSCVGRIGLPLGWVKIRLEIVNRGRFRVEGRKRGRTPGLDDGAGSRRRGLGVRRERAVVGHARGAKGAVFAAAAVWAISRSSSRQDNIRRLAYLSEQ